MTLRLEIKKLMLERSPRVKAIDFHPHNSWVVFGLYSGTLALHDYSNNTCIRTLQASTFPIRAIKFIPQKNWIICGSDDFQLRIFNYNTMQKVKTVEAHGDFIRAIIVHPTQPYVITSSDDSKIKIWNFEKDFSLVRTLDEHKHFVMALAFNPKDLTKFGSTSMDKTIKIWNLTTQGKANFTLNGHKASVNAIDFYKGDKPHLVTGSDDHSIKVWDYQTRQCLQTLEVYKMAITSVHFHPELPLLISTSEDGKTIIHHSGNYTILNTLQYNLGMGWSCGVSPQNPNVIAFGYDEGSVLVKVGSDQPVVTMHSGKILFTKNMEVFNTNLKAISYNDEDKISFEIQRVSGSPKQLGSTDIYPTFINYSPNGHHFGLCNTKQFAVIKIASFKNVILGNGSQLTWHSQNDFVVLENDTIHQYVGFEYSASIKIPFLPETIFEGQLLTVSGKDTTLLYDWNNLSKPLHKLDQQTQKVWWDQEGNTVVISTSDRFNVYQYNKKNFSLTEILQVSDRVTSGCFIGTIFYYMTKSGKIYYSFLGKEFFFCNSDKKQFILGGVDQQNRLYLFDRNNSIYSLYIPFQVLNNVVRFVSGQVKTQPQIPEQFKNRIAKCYHSFNLLKEAYKLTTNLDHKFDLALALGYTRDAYKIATSNNMNQKIKLIGDLSLKKGQIELAIDCFQKIDDLSSLLLVFSSLQMGEKLGQVGQKAQRMTRMNIAYMCYFLTNNPHKCIEVLIKSKRFSEAALFARTYCKQKVSQCVKLWKQSLSDKTLADKISDPTEYEQEQGDQQQDNGQEQNQDGKENGGDQNQDGDQNQNGDQIQNGDQNQEKQ